MIYIMILKAGEASPSKQRISETMIPVAKALKLMAIEVKQAFSSGDGGTTGLFLKTERPVKEILQVLNGETGGNPSVLLHGDQVMIVELGDSGAGLGFGNAWRWLQNN